MATLEQLGEVERIAIINREQWLGLRRQDITASDVPSIMGCGYRTPLQVWSEKTGRIPPAPDNPLFRKGRWFEPAIFEAMAETNPEWKIRRAKVYLRSTTARLGCTPDAVAIDPDRVGIGVIQGKVVSKKSFHDQWECSDDPEDVRVPLYYRLQTIVEAMLVARSYKQHTWAMVAALVHDQWSAELKLFPIMPTPEECRLILDRVAEFWSDIDNDREPAVDPARDNETVKRLFAHDDGSEIDLSQDNEIPEQLARRDTLGEQSKACEHDRKAIDTMIRMKMRDATFARLADGRRLSNKLQQRKSYTVEASEYRMLRVLKG